MQSPNSEGPSGGPSPIPTGPTGEFAVIEGFKAAFEAVARAADPGAEVPPAGETWIGDDAAVVRLPAAAGSGPMLLATDLVVEGVHVDLARGTAGDAGYKALMVAVSDLAAMGARPRYALASVAAAPGTDLEGLGGGLAEAAGDTGCLVVGGDLSTSPCLVVSVAVLGTLDGPGPDARPMLRSGASAGDRVFVTGPLGASAAGLRLLTVGPIPPDGSTEGLVRAHRRPVARIEEGVAARLAGASAAIDVSDGLVADAGHLAQASGVGLALADVPVAEGASVDEALRGGEDYELVVTTGSPDRLVDEFARAGLRAPRPIGVCTGDADQMTLEGRPLPAGGWEHRF